MWIEWATACANAERAGSGWNVEGLGQNGFMATEDQVPTEMVVPVFVCVRMEPGDELGRGYDFAVTVTAPSGAQIGGPGRFESIPVTGPQLIGLQRFYEVLAVTLDVTEGGEYRVVLSDATGERAEVRYLFSVFPSL